MTGPASDPVAALAAVVARQSLDLNLYANFLLNSLAESLGPEYISVERRSSLADRLRGREPQVVSVAVSVGDERFTLLRPNSTTVPTATIGHVVSGIVLRSEAIGLDAWSLKLATALARLAERNGAAAAALANITALDI